MKEIKVILFFLAVATYTSSWWALAMFGPTCRGWQDTTSQGVPIVAFPVIFTIILFAATIVYILKHWDDK